MTDEPDAERIRTLLGPADPVDDLSAQSDVNEVRARLGSTRQRDLGPVAAAMVALLVMSLVVPFVRAPAAWSVEEMAELGEVIRVESPGFFQRGADPDEVVAALQHAGVPVEQATRLEMIPWKTGRVTGVSWSIHTQDQDRGQQLSEQFEQLSDLQTRPEELDLEEVGLALHGDGGFTVFPDAFEDGTLVVNVGRLPLPTTGQN